MPPERNAATRQLIADRRSLLKRIASTETKLGRLQAALWLAEFKLKCFGYDLEALRATRRPKKLFKGRRVYRRILDLQRGSGRVMATAEIAQALADQDGLDVSSLMAQRSGARRIRDALKRARRKHPT